MAPKACSLRSACQLVQYGVELVLQPRDPLIERAFARMAVRSGHRMSRTVHHSPGANGATGRAKVRTAAAESFTTKSATAK